MMSIFLLEQNRILTEYCFDELLLSFFLLDQSLGAEKDNLDIVQHDWALPKFEHRAEAVLKKLVQSWYAVMAV